MPIVSIDTAAAGDTTLVTGVTNARVNVTSLVLDASGPVTVRWKSGSANLSGPMALTTNSGYSLTGAVAILRTNLGDSLILNLSAAVQVSGHLNYYLAPF